MKRLLALAALALLASTSFAGGITQRWVSETLMFRHAAPVNTSQSGFLPDSGVVRHGLTTAQLIYDTTTAIAMGQFELPDYSGRPAIVTIDSLTFFSVSFYPTLNPNFTAGFDSLLIQTQVSMDGVNWINPTPTVIFDATRTAGNATGMIFIENNSLNGVTWYNKQVYNTIGSLQVIGDGATAPLNKELFGWKFIRFIFTDCGETGEFNAWINYWSSRESSGGI